MGSILIKHSQTLMTPQILYGHLTEERLLKMTFILQILLINNYS